VKDKHVSVICPYCNKASPCVDTARIYGGKSYGLAYWCKPCDAMVGCHKGTTIPKGTLADKKTRLARMAAHDAFDAIWKGGQVKRKQAYHWLCRRLGLTEQECHIGMFDESTARLVVAVVKAAGIEAIHDDIAGYVTASD